MPEATPAGISKICLTDANGVPYNLVGGSGLPPQWTKNDATGELRVQGPSGSTAAADNLLTVLDSETGDAIMDIDAAGNVVAHRGATDPDPSHGFNFDRAGSLRLEANSTTSPTPGFALIQCTWNGATVFAVKSHGTNFVVNAQAATDQPLQINGFAGQTSNIIEVWTDDLRYRLDQASRPVISVHSAPADGDLANGECSMWFDDTPAATKVMFKAKDSAGTVKTGSITLS